MWKAKAKQRFRAKGVAGSDTYSEQVRGEVGRGRTGARQGVGHGLTDASRRFLEALGEPMPADFEALSRSVHKEPVASLGANHGPVRRWQDMTEAEREAIRADLEKGAKR
ncbi:MAG TPA: hypothetical protein VFY89_08920 [Ktedonobacterales bacterium]